MYVSFQLVANETLLSQMSSVVSTGQKAERNCRGTPVVRSDKHPPFLTRAPTEGSIEEIGTRKVCVSRKNNWK